MKYIITAITIVLLMSCNTDNECSKAELQQIEGDYNRRKELLLEIDPYANRANTKERLRQIRVERDLQLNKCSN